MTREQEFKDIMKDVPTCVSVVLTDSKLGIHGCTISSLISVGVSENEQLLLFVLKKGSTTEIAIKDSKKFSISVLSEWQKNLAVQFSSDRTPIKKVDFSKILSIFYQHPIIDEASAIFICELVEIIEKSQTNIIICKVIDFKKNDFLKPIIYFNRKFFRVGKEY